LNEEVAVSLEKLNPVNFPVEALQWNGFLSVTNLGNKRHVDFERKIDKINIRLINMPCRTSEDCTRDPIGLQADFHSKDVIHAHAVALGRNAAVLIGGSA
jgi:hypothetical protein